MKGNHPDLAQVLPEQASALKREQKDFVRASHLPQKKLRWLPSIGLKSWRSRLNPPCLNRYDLRRGH
jgi:hypothetical protein